MNFVGAVKIQGVVPCMKCGYGDDCKMTGIKMLHGPEATVDSVDIKSFEEQPTAVGIHPGSPGKLLAATGGRKESRPTCVMS